MPILAVFGATGRTGWRVCHHARAAGYSLRLLVRDPVRLSGDRADTYVGAHVITGDVLDADAVSATVQGADAIISALGADDFRSPGATLAQGMMNIVNGATQHGVRRILAVAGSGVLDSPQGGLRSEQPGFPAEFAAMTTAHRGTWHALRDSPLDWTLACTPDLTEGPGDGHVRAIANLLPANGTQIPRDDLAQWMVGQIAKPDYVGTRVGLAT